jgi:hypothetical protein
MNVLWFELCKGQIMVRLMFAYLAASLALLLCACAVLAQEADAADQKAAEAAKVFESLYGADFKRVRATRDPKDDLELANRLLAAAKDNTNQPEFLAILCEKAADLASPQPDGQGTALEALQLLGATVPGQLSACAARIVDIRQKQFDIARGDDRAKAGEALIDALLSLVDAQMAGGGAGAIGAARRAVAVARVISSPRKNAVEARLSAMEQAARVAPEVEDLKKQVAQDPQNRAAREKLVRRLIVDLDDPAEAAQYVEGVEDASFKKYVPAAAKPVEEVPELACLELAEWYRGMAEAASPAAKAAMCARALTYYRRFLGLHPAQDLSRTQASLAVKKIEDSFAAAPQQKAKAAAGPAVDETHLGPLLLAGLQRKVESSRKGGPPRIIQYKDHILETVEWKAAKGEVLRPAGKIQVGWFDAPNNKWYKGAVNVAAGAFLEGGQIYLENGPLCLLGSAAEPVILKDVDLSADLGDGIQARFTIFVNCKFSKGGGIISDRYTSKWTFDNCIIVQSNFKSLSQVDYGMKFTNCVFLGCTMPKRILARKGGIHPNPNPAETGIAPLYQHQWNNVTRCHFVDCILAPSFVWATKSCDFTNCRLGGIDAFVSTDSLAVTLHVAPKDRAFLDQLTAASAVPSTGRITFENAPSPFAVDLPLESEILSRRK